jgi:DNA-directed RNA polymerase subunit RPC12/RpoP
VFEPEAGCLQCPYCGRSEAIPESPEQVQERSYEDYLRPRPAQLTVLADNALEVRCDSCGATVTFTPPETAGECAFCGTKIVAQPKSADPLVAPESLLPFAASAAQAAEAVKKWLASRWFAPDALKKFAYQESIDGVYLPFWTYDAHTTTHYNGHRGDYYYVTETYTETDAQGNTVTKTRQVRHTRWTPTSGTVSRWMDDVLVPGTKSVSRSRLDALEPWDLPQLKPYDPAYLSGFKAQRYEVDLAEGFEEAKRIMAGVIEGDVRADIGGDEQRIDRMVTSYSAITFKHLLLPVYIGAYRFNQKAYQIMVNARTCEVQGDRPYSFWKIALFVLFLLIIIAVIAYIGGSR